MAEPKVKSEKKSEKQTLSSVAARLASEDQDPVKILDVLANLSATDSWHDFHGDISRFREIIETHQKTYCEGLPLGVTDLGKFDDEGKALSRVVNSKDDYFIGNYGENLVKFNNNKFAEPQTEYSIKTINDTEYSVKPLVVATGSKKDDAGKNYINATDFVNILGLENECAIVIDATAVSILAIFKKGETVYESPGIRKKIYYVITPEVVNDPAGKTSVADKIFDPMVKENENGVELIGCEPNSPESINYNYSYDRSIKTGDVLKSKSTNPYDKFFSAFNFQLSEVQRNRKGKKTEYTTNLLIKSNDSRITAPENVTDSKTKNNITFLTSLIKGAISLLGGKGDSLKNKFLFNTKLQQKRSGDWLQVLACLVLKSRPLKQYNPPGTAPREQSIEKKISKVYFVTHDRVALAFALLLGVECIYTHTATKSCYIFKLSSPADTESANARFLENKKSEFSEMLIKIADAKKYYNETQRIQLGVYNKFRMQNITSKYPEAIRRIGSNYSLLFNSRDAFNATDFVKFTCETFELCLLFDYLLLNFPNIGENADQIVPNIDALDERINSLGPQINVAISEANSVSEELSNGRPRPATITDFNTLKEQINTAVSDYNKIMAQVSTLETSIKKYITNTKPVSIKINIDTTITNFQKSPNRKLASGWSWDNTQGNSRMWEAFKNIVGDTSYKSDKNLFLYNINLLPDDEKVYICEKYLEIKSIIEIPGIRVVEKIGRAVEPTEISTQARLTKFNVVTNGFIAEVFLNFGFQIPSVPATPIPPESPPSPHSAYSRNSRYDVIISSSLCISDAGPLSESAIVDENSEATIINVEEQNFPENFIRAVTQVNYSTEVPPETSDSSGRPIVDLKETGMTFTELNKNKTEADEIVLAADVDSKEGIVQDNSSRKGLEEEDNLKYIKNVEIQKVFNKTTSPETYTEAKPEPEEPVLPGQLEEAVKKDIIKITVEDVEASISTKNKYDSEILKNPPPTSNDVSDTFRTAMEPKDLKNNSGINVKKGATLLGADFEPNIKDATYVLLNALLGYKSNSAQLATFQDKIYEIVHSDYLKVLSRENKEIEESERSPSEVGGVEVPPTSQFRIREKYRGPSDSLQLLPPAPGLQTKQTPLDSLQSLPQPKRGGMNGGAYTENDDLLLEFFESMNLPSIESEESVVEDADTDENLFKSVNYLFHPLLPIYMFAESLNEITGNDHIEESLDYELYQNYLNFLIKLRENVVQEYSSKQPLDVAKAFMIGVSLREFLFHADVYSLEAKSSVQDGGRREPISSSPSVKSLQDVEEDDALIDVGMGNTPKSELTESHHPEEYFEFENQQPPEPEPELQYQETSLYCDKVLGMTKDEFLPVSILTGVFNYFISGIQHRSEEENAIGKKMLHSKLFTSFMNNVQMGNIFKEIIDEPEPINSFKRKCLVFLLETGNIIISDRGGVPLEIPPEGVSDVLLPTLEIRRELQARAAEGRRGFGGSKKIKLNKEHHNSKRNRKNKVKVTKINKKIKLAKQTKKNK
jgi:hypothetical protein